jgi:hypothetical protein
LFVRAKTRGKGQVSVGVLGAPSNAGIPRRRLCIPPSAISGTEQRILATTLILAGRDSKMPDEEWIKTLEDGRKVKFIYQELPEDGAFITAQLAGNEIVYSVVLTQAGNPLSREDVESHFEGELSKK